MPWKSETWRPISKVVVVTCTYGLYSNQINANTYIRTHKTFTERFREELNNSPHLSYWRIWQRHDINFRYLTIEGALVQLIQSQSTPISPITKRARGRCKQRVGPAHWAQKPRPLVAFPPARCHCDICLLIYGHWYGTVLICDFSCLVFI